VKPRSRVEVILELCTPYTDLYFVEIVGLPGKTTCVVGNARPLAEAQKLKGVVEQSLRDFEKPFPTDSPPTTAWDRLLTTDILDSPTEEPK
jgi:hypothetical protein